MKEYRVKLIPAELGREETMVRVATALEDLDTISADLSRRLGDRVAVSEARLRSVRERVQRIALKGRLRVEPSTGIEFEGSWEVAVTREVSVVNSDPAHRVAFKIKTTENELFKVKPVMGIVEEGGKFPVSIMFRPNDHEAPSISQHLTLTERVVVDSDTMVFNARKIWQEEPGARHIPSHQRVPFRFKTVAATIPKPRTPKALSNREIDSQKKKIRVAKAKAAVPIVEIEPGARSVFVALPPNFDPSKPEEQDIIEKGAFKPKPPAADNSGDSGDSPDDKPESPAAKPESPAAKPESPAAKPESPAAKPDGPPAKPDGPPAKPDGPSAKPDGPPAKPPKAPAADHSGDSGESGGSGESKVPVKKLPEREVAKNALEKKEPVKEEKEPGKKEAVKKVKGQKGGSDVKSSTTAISTMQQSTLQATDK